MSKNPQSPTLQDLEPGLLIDENRLEQACARHPDLFYRVSKRLTHEISLRDMAKEQLANVEAETDARIREEAAEDEDAKKLTEKEIESRKRLDSAVKKWRDQYLAYSHSVAQWTALKDAFLQRSYMLKSLGELYVANYYSDTSTGGASIASAQAARAKQQLQEERVRRR